MKKAIIFGIDGQDGSYLAELLLEKEYQVTGWIPEALQPNYPNIQSILDRLSIIRGDLTDQAGLIKLIEAHAPDEVYNLASPSFPADSWDHVVSVGDITGLGAVRLLEAIRLVKPDCRFYQASSSELFGEPLESPQNEQTPFRPRNPYGIAKLYAHWTVVRYRERYCLHAVSGILFNHESPRRGEAFVTRKITKGLAEILAGKRKKISLGNIESSRDWGYAPDYVEAMWRMLQQENPDDYVIGTGELHSIRDFLDHAFGSVGLDWQDYVELDTSLYRSENSLPLVADPTKARKELGWTPSLKFREIVKIMVELDLKKEGFPF